eukprot:403355796
MRADHSLKIYPRPDQEYKKKTSLDFQKVWGNVYKMRPTGNIVQAYMWLLCLIIGSFMGIIAFLLDISVEWLMHVRWEATQYIVPNNPGLGWFALIIISSIYVLITALLVVFFTPTALGSGVAEAMGILNGVGYSDYICPKTLVVKFVGLALAVSGGICGGKEGPLVHMGSIVGYLSAYLPFSCFRYFRNDLEKRKLLAIGTAAGVSAAFGSPIGGSLFAYEMSKPSTFWSFSLTWKIFFASSISTFVLSILQQLYHGKVSNIAVVNSGSVKLASSLDVPYLDSLFAAVVVGVVGGLLGALFIIINNKVNVLRKKVLTQKWMKVAEAVFLVILTVTVFFVCSQFTNTCIKNDPEDFMIKKGIEVKRFTCPEGYYNRLATLLFNSQSNIIHTFMSDGNNFKIYNVGIFIAVWYFFTCVTSGTAVPCGIFLPCILIGCALGYLYNQVHVMIFTNQEYTLNAETMAILGATAMLSGSTRMTYSLAVIMLETTSNVELFLPIIFTLLASYGAGSILINKSIYLGALRSKNIPVIGLKIPTQNRHLSAYNLMAAPVSTFPFLVKVGDVFFQLKNTKYNGFPVLNDRSQPIGIVERDSLILLIEKQAWYEHIDVKRMTSDFQEALEQPEQQERTSSFLRRYDKYRQNTVDIKREERINTAVNESITESQSDLMHDMLDKQDQDQVDSDLFDREYPKQVTKLKWEDLNQNYSSAEKSYQEVEQIAIQNSEQILDLRPYMIERPFMVTLRDSIEKVHMMFRCLHLRQLLVTNFDNGEIQGIITRQDLFQYMTL